MSSAQQKPKAKRDTKRLILDICERYLMQWGYNVFSYHHIADELGVKNAAIHYHFRTKSDLAVAVLLRYRARFIRWTQTVESLPPQAQLDAYMRLSLHFVLNQRVGVLVTLGTEYNTLPEPLQEQVKLLQDEIFTWFAALLERGRSSGDFVFNGTAHAMASLIATTRLGSQLLGRVRGIEPFEEVVEQVHFIVGMKRNSP